MIEFESVTKVFPGGTIAVDDVNLVAPAGLTTVIFGPPGSGKSILLRMVNRMVDPSAGTVLVDGDPNTSLRRSVLRRRIGYVIPGGLFPHRTVIRNIATVPLLLGSDRGAARGVAAKLMELVGLPEVFADKYPAQLSLGQQARVTLARALAADPPVLLMDSPFSGLDPAVRQDLQDDLLELQRVAPRTILFATHDIDEAIKLGDQIGVLAGGRLVQLATPQAMLAQPGSDYVSDLLGRDRGIRKLTFLPAGEIPLTPAVVIPAGTSGAQARATADSLGERWLLVLDAEGRPRGWVDVTTLGPESIVSGPVVHPLGGSFYRDESVLAALDAAVLSPAGLAVCLDDDGTPLGVVNHAGIARYLQALPPPGAPGTGTHTGGRSAAAPGGAGTLRERDLAAPAGEPTAATTRTEPTSSARPVDPALSRTPAPPVAPPAGASVAQPPSTGSSAPSQPTGSVAPAQPAVSIAPPQPAVSIAPSQPASVAPRTESSAGRSGPGRGPTEALRPRGEPGTTEPRRTQRSPSVAPEAPRTTGTTWTTRQEPGATVTAGAPPNPRPAPATPTVKEPRGIPVVPPPAAAPNLRSTPAKPATLPAVRNGEPGVGSSRSGNGAIDPVTRWLIGTGQGEAPARAEDAEPRAAETPSAAASTTSSGARRGSGWDWNSELGEWTHISDSSDSGAVGGSSRGKGGER